MEEAVKVYGGDGRALTIRAVDLLLDRLRHLAAPLLLPSAAAATPAAPTAATPTAGTAAAGAPSHLVLLVVVAEVVGHTSPLTCC